MKNLKNEILKNNWQEFTILEVEKAMLSMAKVLDDREIKVLELYFLEEKSLAEISDELKVCRERVRQIKDNSLRKIRNLANAKREEEELRKTNEKKIELAKAMATTSIYGLKLNLRICNALHNANYNYVGEVIMATKEELENIKGLGLLGQKKIREKIEELLKNM